MFQRSPLLARALTALLLVAGASAPGFATEPPPAPPAPPAPSAAPARTPTAEEVESTATFIRFMLALSGGQETLKGIAIDQAGNDQEMRALMTRAMDAHFDMDEMARRMARSIAGHVTAEEIANAVQLADSEDGKLMLSIAQNSASSEEKKRALESLLLSLALCIEHLLSVEVSALTRRASLALLQMYAPFWRDVASVRTRAEQIATGLGGRLQASAAERKAALLAQAVGTERATRWIDVMRRLRLGAEVRWDEALHRWTP